MINWPAVLKYRGDNELVFVADEAQWLSDSDLHTGHYDTDDYLIDSQGMIHRISEVEGSDILVPVVTGKSVSLDDVVEWVRAHMSEVGLCCVSKFSAGSIEEAISMVGTFE